MEFQLDIRMVPKKKTSEQNPNEKFPKRLAHLFFLQENSTEENEWGVVSRQLACDRGVFSNNVINLLFPGKVYSIRAR